MNEQLSLSGVPHRSVPGCHPSQDFCNTTAAGFARSQMALTIASTAARESRQAYAQLLSMGQQCALVLIEKAFLNFEANAALVLGTIDALSSCGDLQQVANRQAEFVHQMGKQWSEQMEDYSEIFSIIITDIANATKAAAEKSSLRTGCVH